MTEDTGNHSQEGPGDSRADDTCTRSPSRRKKLLRGVLLLLLIEVLVIAGLVARPLIARSSYDKAASLYEHEMPERAIKYCRRTLALAPDHAEAWELIAYCQDMQKRPQEALRSLDTAIRLDPMMVSAYVESGQLMVRQGMYDKAIARFRQASCIDPENLAAAHFSILCFAALGETEKAEKECRRALEIFPDDDVIRRWLRELKAGEMRPGRPGDEGGLSGSAAGGALDAAGQDS